MAKVKIQLESGNHNHDTKIYEMFEADGKTVKTHEVDEVLIPLWQQGGTRLKVLDGKEVDKPVK